jgi:hypothetical protein
MENKFKVGDIVTGNELSNGEYGIISTDMLKGEVVDILGREMTIRVLEHNCPQYYGDEYVVKQECFDLVEDKKEVNSSKDKEDIKAETPKSDAKITLEDMIIVAAVGEFLERNYEDSVAEVAGVRELILFTMESIKATKRIQEEDKNFNEVEEIRKILRKYVKKAL